uniref:CS domain-containing protein n=1 Tax=Meloidogyne incognita TaxID=6306 RepID=A0A914MV64_MELIC
MYNKRFAPQNFHKMPKPPEKTTTTKRRTMLIPLFINSAAQKVLERRQYSSNKFPDRQNEKDFENLVGAVCKNNGCTAVCNDKNTFNSICIHHRGLPASRDPNSTAAIVSNNSATQYQHLHNHQQYWTCCGRKTTNLLGCTKGSHRWIIRQRVDENIRHDWFYRGGHVHLSIFSRSTVPQGTRVESDGLTLDVVIAHGFGLKETVRHFDLYAEILPAESLVLVSEKKVEIILKQMKREHWPRLCHEEGVGAVCVFDDDGGAMCDLDDD